MKSARSNQHAFTLIEIMLVVAIMGVALAMGYPAISDMVHRAPLAQGVRDVMEGCRKARALAILQGSPAELRIYPQDGRMEVASSPADLDATAAADAATPTQPTLETDPVPTSKPAVNFSAQLAGGIRIELLDVNFNEYKDADLARVKFYPNGTSDEFTLILNSDAEWRKITLEVVTGLAGVDIIK